MPLEASSSARDASVIGLAGGIATAFPVVVALSGLDQLSVVGSNMEIGGNFLLQSLSGLNNLSVVNGNLSITGNLTLKQIEDISHLSAIQGTLWLERNDELVSLKGLDSIDVSTIYSLQLLHSENMSDCASRTICAYLAAPGKPVTIFNNATGCQTVEEINNACALVGIDSDIKDAFIRPVIFPNPTQTTFEIQGISGHEKVWVEITDLMGRMIRRSMPYEGDPVDIHELPGGIYLVEVSVESQSKQIRLIKE